MKWTTLKSSNQLPTKVTLTYLNEKPTFWPNLAFQKQKKWIFCQIWNYLIWPNMARDSHRTPLQYLISHFSGQLIKIKISFQPGVKSQEIFLFIFLLQFMIHIDVVGCYSELDNKIDNYWAISDKLFLSKQVKVVQEKI